MLNKILHKLWLELVSLDRIKYYQDKEKEFNKLDFKYKSVVAFLNQYEQENEEMEKEVDEMEQRIQELEKIEKEYKKMTQLDRVIKIDREDLEDFEPTQVKSMINLITNIQKQITEESLTIRVVEWIAHRDWAVRSLWILKLNLQKLLKAVKQKPKE